MASDQSRIAAFRARWSGARGVAGATDYELLAEQDGAFIARSKAGLAALVLPVEDLGPLASGRRASGCELLAHPTLHFALGGAEWDGAAAAFLCADSDLLDTFAVLANDVLARTAPTFTWPSIVAVVEEWQTLLRPRGKPSKETELGLWGELWFIEQSRDIARALAAWRGPEGDHTDFFERGVAVEVKASRAERQHFVSQAQVESPVGGHDAWLLSIWAKADPGSLLTVPFVADAILARAPDRGEAMRLLARAGYSPADRQEYATPFTLLSEPEWFAAPSVPRVRAADPGVSNLRYRVVLDSKLRADAATARRLWHHFHGRDYGSDR
jgi:hypothetical protein